MGGILDSQRTSVGNNMLPWELILWWAGVGQWGEVCNGCVVSPDLFSVCGENIVRGLEGMREVAVGELSITNIRYAENIVLNEKVDKFCSLVGNVLFKMSS